MISGATIAQYFFIYGATYAIATLGFGPKVGMTTNLAIGISRSARGPLWSQEGYDHHADHSHRAEIRHDIHRHPEVGFEEVRTAALVADRLRSWGLDVTE
jgi:hypothetical protein